MNAPANIDSTPRDNRAAILRSLSAEGSMGSKAAMIVAALREAGLQQDDPRLCETHARLEAIDPTIDLDEVMLDHAIAAGESTLVNRALCGKLVIPGFANFGTQIGGLFEKCREERSGDVARYIPQLARVEPDKFGLGLCTVDGQRLALGDSEDRFCIQSVCKPINYAIASDLNGRDRVHAHVGREPSGRTFNELTLNSLGLPHNPMINAGAIMCASLIKPEETLADRFDFVMQTWRELSGIGRPGFDNAVYLSEKSTADRNFALAYFMRENGAFPPNTNLLDTLDFYFQCCSITLDVKQMSVVAGTLANGGICPVTNRRIFSAEAVKDCLSLMYSCGMYDFSGEYAFTVGIPAKSGVSGALMLVVPGVCGFAVWSPRLDACGNSVRGVSFSKRLVEAFAFHSYANMVDNPLLIDPTMSETMRVADEIGHLCAVAARGDISELRRLIASGIDVSRSDYDGRTALHLAASEGRVEAARLLISAGCETDPKDRWGNTPLDDAKRESQAAIIEILGAVRNQRKGKTTKIAPIL